MRISIIVAFLAFLSTDSLSQHWGLKGGMNFSTLKDVPDTLSYTYKPGIHIGGYYELRVSGNINFQPEIMYSSQGAWAEQNNDFRFRYNYILVPLILKLYFTEKVQVHAGPQFGFLISAETDDGQFEVDITDQVKTFDMAISLGLGYENPSGFNFNARFNFGITSTAFNKPSTGQRFTNQVFQLSAGYTFNK